MTVSDGVSPSPKGGGGGAGSASKFYSENENEKFMRGNVVAPVIIVTLSPRCEALDLRSKDPGFASHPPHNWASRSHAHVPLLPNMQYTVNP